MQYLIEHAKATLAVAVLLIALLTNAKKLFYGAAKATSWVIKKSGRTKRMETMLISIFSEIEDVKKDVSMLRAIDTRRFREENHPEFLCTKEGKNIRVSDAYLDLLGLNHLDDLVRINWQNFIHQDDFDGYFEGFKRASEGESNFKHSIRFINRDNKDVGEWSVDAKRVNGHYLGRIKPLDSKASEIANSFGWTY